MAFDVEGALAAGYSRSDIADYLASQKNFDVSGARKAGYSDDDILTHLLPEKPLAKTVSPAAPKITTVENPLSAKEPGLIDRAVTAIKGLTSPSSVMEGYTSTPEQQQKSVDQRLALGQGPISETAISKAQDIRAGRLKTEDEGLKRVARALQQQQAPTLEGVVSEVEPYIDRGYQAGEFGGDVSKQFGGAAVGGTLKIPSGIETGLRGLVRNVLSGDALTATPAGRLITTAQTALADTFGLRSVAEQTADKEAAKVTIDRALSGIPTIPGTAELAQYGDRVQKDIQDSISITGKKLIAGSTPSGNIFKGELSFGDDPTLSGYALQASSVFGSLAPFIATLAVTGSPTAAAGVGGGMAAGEAADAARTYISKLTDAQLQETSPYYQTLIKRGVPPQEARTIITDKAAENGAMLQGMVAAVGDRITGKFLTGAYNDILSRVGGKTVLGRVGVGIAGGAAEEGTQELFEGLASDIGIRSQIANKEIGEDSAANLILGALGGAGPGAYQGARTPVTPDQEIANIINANVANMQPVGTREAAVAALSPEFADSNTLAQGILRSATVDDAIAAADQAAGSITAPSFVPPAIAPVPFAAPAIAPAEPIIPIAPVAEIQQPATNLGRIEPTLPPVTEPTPVTSPEIRSDLPILAPRPQRIQGQPVANLTDDQLSSVVEDQTLPAITRRGAQIELDARRTEQRTGRVEPTLEPFATPAAEPMGGRVEPTLEPFAPPGAPAAPLPTTAAEPVAGAIDTAAIRADAQRYVDEQAAAEGRESPVQLNPAPAAEQKAVQDIGQALDSQFGANFQAYSDPRDVAVNGFAYKGVAFVNVANVPIDITRTSLHEFKHRVEQIAQAEAQAGLTGTPAQKFVADIDSIFDDMTDEGKTNYLVNFLAKEELAKLTGRAREKRLRQLLSSPTLRSEMTADFLGNRAPDRAFWEDTARQDPEGFKDFVEKWLKIIDNLLATLRGTKTQGQKESAKVDKYIRDFNVAKMVARDALIDYRRGTLVQTEKAAAGKPAASLREGEGREENIPARGEGVLPSTEGAGPSAGELGRGEIPSYGKGREGAVSVIGRHYSPRVQTSLSGRYYGTGIRGAESNRIRESKDRRIGDRIYFYVDTGSGIRPESGVGRFAHEVRLNNIYDTSTGLIPPQGSANAFESAVIDAGFDGYMAPFGRGAAVVLLGPKHDAVPVKPLEPAAYSKREKAAPARVMFEVAPDPNNVDLKTRWDAVPFERKIEISQRVAEKIMPQVFKLAGVKAKMTTQLGGYLDDTSPSFAALVPDTASAQQVMDVARIGGFGLAQDSMMVLDLKEFEGSSPTGLITVVLPENMVDQESVHEIYRALRQVSSENISGHTTVGNEMVLAVPSDRMDDLASKIEGVLNSRPENFTLKTDEGHMAFPTKEEYDYGQEGEGAPELLAKRAEARRIREEASAAIEDELTKDESTGGRQIDTGVYRSIADDFGLSPAEYNASALPMMLGKTGSNTFRAPKIGGIPEVVEWLDKRYRDAGMPSLDLNKAEDRTTLAKIMAAEAVGAIKSAGTAVEWYDDTIRKTLQIMAVKYPELNTDANARNAFLMAVAISSQTMNVEDNLRYASNQYDAYRASVDANGVGQFPEVGTGKSAPAMGNNFALANRLLEEMKPELLRRFLQTEFTKRELESIGFKISGESMNEKMLGSAVFGPKIGFGFYSNLSGNFEPVTMDMWFMRTIGRLTGKLPAFDEKLFDKQVANLRSAIAETGDSSKGLFAADFDQALVDEAMKSDDGAIALARAVNSLHNRQFTKERAKFDSKERYKTNLVGAAGTILKSADKPKDSPGGGGERQRLRDVVRQMVALVEAQTGKRVPPAALQALIWYPEQELYKKLGVKLRVTSQDYAGAAKSLLTKEGFDGKRISAAAESRPRPAQPVAGGKVAGPTAKAGAKGESTGPLKGKEREAFVGPRVAERLKEEAEALPLVDVFTGLQKRGLPKTKMEAKVERRDDAARIKYVQDNFLDILSELEDSGKVKINCD